MEQDQIVKAALAKLESTEVLMLQIAAAHFAIRALISSHPDREAVRAVYDQLAAQLLAAPVMLDDSPKGVVFRDCTRALFEPKIFLDT